MVRVLSRLAATIAALVLLATPAAPALTQADIDRVAAQATRGLKRVTRSLASNLMRGRDNDTPESAAAQRYLIARLKRLGTGPNAAASGDDAYRQPFTLSGQNGTNLFAVVRGRELPDEYVIVGAHYDHLDSRSDASGHCSASGPPGGDVCNGATDNATGDAAVLAIGRALHALPELPRRSVLLALWDAEEDGLLGSRYYVDHPLVPLAQTVAYVNFDILGADLLPSVRSTSFAVGSETGGTALRGIVDAAVTGQSLNVRPFSYIFGQLRSDYANFVNAGVPTVFFSDSTGGCYHTSGDDVRVVNFPKLAQQTAIAFRTVVALAEASAPPVFTPPNPNLAVFEDAVSLQQALAPAVAADLALFGSDDQATITSYKAQVDQIVADGPSQFDTTDVGTILTAAINLIGVLTRGGCKAF